MPMGADATEAWQGTGASRGGFVPAPVWGPWSAALWTCIIALAPTLTVGTLYRQGLIPAQVGPGDTIGVGLLLPWQVIVVALTLLLALRHGRPVAALALGPPRQGARGYAFAIAVVIAFELVVTGLEYGFARETMQKDIQPILDLAKGPLWGLGLIVVGIGAPLSEELLFRGFLLPALAVTRIGFLGATLVSTGLWTMMHLSYSAVGLAEIFGVGLLFSWLLWRTGSLRVTILCHALYNSVLLLGLRFLPL
jgi:membrane protease YdiL (CAAX protease family)